MKFRGFAILIFLSVLLGSTAAKAAGWMLSLEDRRKLLRDFSYEPDRQKLYNQIKNLLDRGMDVESLITDGSISLLTNFCSSKWYREGHPNKMDPDIYVLDITEWDYKIIDLFLAKGANINFTRDADTNSEKHLLWFTLEAFNLDIAKYLIKKGANYKLSYPTGSFKARENTMTITARANDLEAHKYFDQLLNYPADSVEYCSVSGTVMVGEIFWKEFYDFWKAKNVPIGTGCSNILGL